METITTADDPILVVHTGRGAQVRKAKFKVSKMVDIMGWKAIGTKLVDFTKSVEMEWEKKRVVNQRTNNQNYFNIININLCQLLM